MPKKIKPEIDPPNLNTKVGKYFIGVQKGLKKKEALQQAGYINLDSGSTVEKSKQYNEIRRYYRDSLQDEITVGDIAREHAKIILQDNELGPKVAAIKMAIEKIEPEQPEGDDDEKVMVILRSS